METKTNTYIPQVFRSFQGFNVKDIKEWRNTKRMEIILESNPEREHFCCRCGCDLGRMNGGYLLRCHHMRAMGWLVVVCVWREKRFCPACNKIRSEADNRANQLLHEADKKIKTLLDDARQRANELLNG